MRPIATSSGAGPLTAEWSLEPLVNLVHHPQGRSAKPRPGAAARSDRLLPLFGLPFRGIHGIEDVIAVIDVIDRPDDDP